MIKEAIALLSKREDLDARHGRTGDGRDHDR